MSHSLEIPRMIVALAVTRICAEINGHLRVMRPAPGQIVADEIVRAGVKEQIDTALAESVPISRYKHAI